MLFETIAETGHEQIVYCHSKDASLKAIIAIHNSVLGPALGGLRMWPYANEADAVRDVLKHSADMTYKAAIAGLNTAYSAAVLGSWRRAAFIGALLVALYAVLYILLSLEAFSLLIGSLLLFAALAGVMYATRSIDWSARREEAHA